MEFVTQNPKGFANAAQGACPKNRHTYSGCIFIHGNSVINQILKKQRSEAHREAENMTLTKCTKKLYI